MEIFSNLQAAENFIFSKIGKDLRVATPLGLGKPNQLLNLLYQRVKKDPSLSLTLFTALSLDIPKPKSDLEKRFVEPFFSSHFGDDYPQLDYLKDLQSQQTPSNIQVHEFYFQAGTMLHSPRAQQNYISLNYTHVAQNIFAMNIEVIVQLIAKSPDGKGYSLSCNPDLTLDLVDLYKIHQRPLLMVGVVHPDLPYLGGDAEVGAEFFSAIVESSEVKHQLFSLPRTSVQAIDHMIGLHASRLICDDGTLQIGIGSLSDGIVSATVLRHQDNPSYNKLLKACDAEFSAPKNIKLHQDIFQQGLYGTSEMLMDGFMHLRKAGVLMRNIFDKDEQAARYLHGAFFLGSKEFYHWLKHLNADDFKGLSMTRVSKVNDLYDEHELSLRRQRKNARFFNTTMKVSLLGEAASETLEDGSVISGVGGQYNFVAMSHELPDSLSVLLLKSTREAQGKRISNIVWAAGHITIPRHLRDIVVTEYGIANLKGQSDEECIKRLLLIADSEFQKELLKTAQGYGKISSSWEIPEFARNNKPERIEDFVKLFRSQGFFPLFPMGSDFTPEEQTLQDALLSLKEKTKTALIACLIRGFKAPANEYQPELKRMTLQNPTGLKENLFQRVLLGALAESKRKGLDSRI
jgi:acyl-CoA hydrolase